MKKIKYISLSVTAIILIVLLVLISLFIYRRSNPSATASDPGEYDVFSSVCISEENGLYAYKNPDMAPCIYDTSYILRILALTGREPDAKTMKLLSDPGAGFTDTDILSELDRAFLFSGISADLVPAGYCDSLVKSAAEKDGFICTDRSRAEITDHNRINETYTSLCILKNCGITLPEEDSAAVAERFRSIISETGDDRTFLLSCRVLDMLSIPCEEYVSRAADIFLGLAGDEEWDEHTIDIVSLFLETDLFRDCPEVSTELGQTAAKAKKICDGTQGLDISVLYRLAFIVSRISGGDPVLVSMAEKLEDTELINGGFNCAHFIGTAKETLMMSVIGKYLGTELPADLPVCMERYFSTLTDGESLSDNMDELYSCLAYFRFCGMDAGTDMVGKCSAEAAKSLGKAVDDDNFRLWFYSVKLLDTVGYQFSSEDLPANCDELISETVSDADKAIRGNDINTLMRSLILIDGLRSIDSTISENADISSFLGKCSAYPTGSPYWSKVRYYALLCLSDSAAVSDTFRELENLKKGSMYSADASSPQGDLQSTFQACALGNIIRGVDISYVR